MPPLNDTVELTKKEKEEIKEAFDLFDADGSGSIDSDELLVFMKAMGCEATDEEVKSIIKEADADGGGSITYDEYLKVMTQKMLNKDPIAEAKRAFRLLDKDQIGQITFKNLQQWAKDLGYNKTNDQLREMFEHADGGGKGYVTEEDFYRVVAKVIDMDTSDDH
mmetsp:Transcript_27381/g.63204  ORF Transcript_27381/g.63204 Transcript_27381/m.63204 type:complete len:164 (-) Transcript_27381:29-520(-)